jgi:opacity protein-like surface antigen
MSRRALLVILFLAYAAVGARAQGVHGRPSQKFSLRVMGGVEYALGHEGFTKYWAAGPNVDVQFLAGVLRGYWLGVELDVSGYWFRAAKFATENPGIPGQNKPVAHMMVGIVWRADFNPADRFRMYGGTSIGFAQVTPAEYAQVQGGVKKMYFRIPETTRASVGLFVGAEYLVNKKIGIDFEPRLLYIHNNPDVGLVLSGRAGVRYIW